jgi:hypothetical protein
LRFVTATAGGAITLFGLRRLAAQPMDLALLVERSARGRTIAVFAALADATRLEHGIRPGALQAKNFGAMHETGIGERDHAGLSIAPA